MKKTLAMVVVLTLAGTAFAGTMQKWTAGWDNFGEPLNYKKSNVTWSVASTKLTVTYTLVGATPRKLYQVDMAFFCTTFANTFGQFPVGGLGSGNTCQSLTRQGVTASAAYVELCVVATDINGNGSCKVVVSPVAAGTYAVEFRALDGAGSGGLSGGAGNDGFGGNDENADFQSPGPFGTTTSITIP
ncbi:MAG: hypothetical protein WCB53_04850 [Terriglobales bacterium]